MATINFNLTAGENGKSVTVFIGDAYTITDDNQNWQEVYDLLTQNQEFTDEQVERLQFLLSPQEALSTAFRRVSEQVSIRNGKVFFDGESVSNAIAEFMLDAYKENDDIALTSVARFMERLQANPNQHSRDHLFRWMKNRSFYITPDGYLLAFKGVSRDSGGRVSSSRGYGIVNGVEYHDSHLPNNDGDIVEMPRSMVTFNPSQGCSVGLHAGTWSYAKNFASVLIVVKVNPRDVVSVPTDSGDAKMRVRMYEVLGEPKTTHPKGLFATETDLVPGWTPGVTPSATAVKPDVQAVQETLPTETYSIVIDRSASMVVQKGSAIREGVAAIQEAWGSPKEILFHAWQGGNIINHTDLDSVLRMTADGGTDSSVVARFRQNFPNRHIAVVTDYHDLAKAVADGRIDPLDYIYKLPNSIEGTSILIPANDLKAPEKAPAKKAPTKKAKKVAKKATAKKAPAKHKGLGVSDVVELTKFSTTWVKDHAAELGGTKNPETKQWEFGNKTQVKAALKKLGALK